MVHAARTCVTRDGVHGWLKNAEMGVVNVQVR